MPLPALYTGLVRHRRFHPKRHGFTYPVFQALVDLDAVECQFESSVLVGHNRFAWASFHDADYGPAGSGSLKARYRAQAERQGFAFPKGRCFLLTNLRILGFVFNPVSYLYAYDRDGRLALIGAEVTNTPWKERCWYWMKPEGTASAHAFTVPKAMHVSPFMPMDLRYRWTFTAPGADLKVRMALFDGEQLVFDADLDLEAHPWSARTLQRVLLRFPFTTLKVVAAIHWEALRLWIKRVPVFTHPSKSAPSAASPGA